MRISRPRATKLSQLTIDADLVMGAHNITLGAGQTVGGKDLSSIEAGATADQTGAEIKTLYQAEANAYTDAKNTKLSGIDTGAKDDQTGAEIKALYEAEANAFTDALKAKLDGIEAAAKIGDMLLNIYDNDEDGVFGGAVMQLGKAYIIGDEVLHSHDGQQTHDVAEEWHKEKTITINTLYPTPSTLRIKFDLYGIAGNKTGKGRIYKNGAPVGTERTRINEVWETFSEDLEFAQGDTLELWLWTELTYGAQIRNFRVHGIEGNKTLQQALTDSDVGSDGFAATNT